MKPRTRADKRTLLGYPLDAIDLDGAVQRVLDWARQPGAARLVVTLNPEIVVQAEADPGIADALRRADLSVADGVGIAWAARLSGAPLPGRVPGVDLATRVLAEGGADLRVFLLGGRPGVAQTAAARATERYGSVIVGAEHGYFDRVEDALEVCGRVRASGAQLLLAGLGEGQERFLDAHRDELGTPVMIGVGGTLDVLAGNVKRMPAVTSRLGLEWLFRVGLDPKRWRRVPRLARFVWLVLRSREGRT